MQIVGASGAVMGFVGLTVADIAINSGDLLQILLRLIIILAAVVFFIVTAVTKVFAALRSHRRLTTLLYTQRTCQLPWPDSSTIDPRRAVKTTLSGCLLMHASCGQSTVDPWLVNLLLLQKTCRASKTCCALRELLEQKTKIGAL